MKKSKSLRTLEYSRSVTMSPLIHDPGVKAKDFSFPERQVITESVCLIKS